MPPALSGFALGASLIVAIGAQNAYLLRQGLRREHVGWLATICFVSDALLIALGCAGLGTLVQAHPDALRAVRWIGVAFLLWYGLRSARAALKGDALKLEADTRSASRGAAVRTMLALTWLNPHVYLDTVVLLGGIAGRYAGNDRLGFACGAMTASGLWFFGLGFGAARLAPLFERPGVWRVLDALIALTMWAIALSLIVGA